MHLHQWWKAKGGCRMGLGLQSSSMGRVMALVVSLWVGNAGAAPVTPTEAIRATINQVIEILEDDVMKQPGHTSERRRLLEEVIGARFNYEEMSKRTLGAQWKRLTEPQREEFVALFQRFLADRYADKIEGYTGEDIRYFGERIEGAYAEVRTEIVSGKLEIPMDYRMISRSGRWRVYDVVIDGVSLVRNYRGQFDKIIEDSSYAELVRRLRERSESQDTKGELGWRRPTPWEGERAA